MEDRGALHAILDLHRSRLELKRSLGHGAANGAAGTDDVLQLLGLFVGADPLVETWLVGKADSGVEATQLLHKPGNHGGQGVLGGLL